MSLRFPLRRWLILIAVISAIGIVVWIDHRIRAGDTGPLRSSGARSGPAGTSDPRTNTPIRLGYVKGLSQRFTTATGTARLNFVSGEVRVTVEGLDPLPPGSAHEVWLLEHRAWRC
ncbi:MAG: hypothetical protein HY652_03825 [Acidobacteria bacterium]|nr:hypothetical protein [Acidobacteriota bacterium]